MGLLKRLQEFFVGKKQAATQQRNTQSKVGRNSGNYLAFDLEIAKVLPGDFSRWRRHRPLGIACAATVCNGHSPVRWYSISADGSIADKMNQEDIIRLVKYLETAAEKGWQIISWNGLGFDFDVLAEESGCWDACRELALGHIDMMFHLFCLKGYPLSLDKAAKGMRLSGKTQGMSGELAPVLWQQGEFQKVLDYVTQDVQTTLELAKAGVNAGGISWISNKGNHQSVLLRQGWLPVNKALEKPIPDNSWMSNPMSRDEFIRWTKIPQKNYLLEPAKQTAPLQQSPSDKRPSLNVVKSMPKRELSVDEISQILARDGLSCDGEPLFEESRIESYKTSEMYDVMEFGCPCPICQGVPNQDVVFLSLEAEDDCYPSDYDDYWYDEDW